MKKLLRKIQVLVISITCILTITSCEKTDDISMNDKQADYVTATLFSDVSFWEPPVWDTKAGTITGDISAKTGVKIETEVPKQEADVKLKLKLLNDDLPDIISITDDISIQQLVSSGKVWKLEEFLKEYKPDSHLLTQFPEDIKQQLINRDGAWYAIPSHMNSADARKIWKSSLSYWDDVEKYYSNNAIIWNKALLEKLGLHTEELQTEEQVLAAFETAKQHGIIPLLLDGDMYQESLKYLQWSFGAEWVDAEGNFKDILLQPESKEALKFLNTAIRNEYADSKVLMYENVKIKELIASGRVLCFIGNVANTSAVEEWTSTGVVLSSQNTTPVFGRKMQAQTGWMQTFISKDCKHPKEVAEWLDYMTSDEGKMLWFYGYEGKDYTIGEDGIVQRAKEREDATAHYTETGFCAWWMFENEAWKRSLSAPGEGYGELLMAFGKYKDVAVYDESLLMFPSDLLPVGSDEYNMEKEITAWKDSQILVTILTQTDEAFETEYQTLINGLKERGIERIDEIKNQAYQANCETYHSRIEKAN